MPNQIKAADLVDSHASVSTRRILTPGNMASVEAYEVRPGVNVVEKQVALPPLGDPDRIETMNAAMNEASVGSRINDLNFVACAIKTHYEADQQGERLRILTPEVHGQELSFQDEMDLVRRSSEIAQKLAILNEQKDIVHGDLKPRNIIIDQSDNQAVLIDFGSSVYNGERMVYGTPEFASPEALQGQPVDGRHDVYALASMVAEYYLGTTPNQYLSFAFTDQSQRDQMEYELSRKCNVPGLVSVVMAGLDPSSKSRPELGAFAKSLEALSPESTAFPHFSMAELLKVSDAASLGRFLRQFRDNDYIENPQGGIANSNFKYLHFITASFAKRSGIYHGQNTGQTIERALRDIRQSLTTKKLPRAFTGGTWSDKDMNPLQEGSVRVAISIINKLQQMDPECRDVTAGSILSHIVSVLDDPDAYMEDLKMQSYWSGKEFMSRLVNAYISAPSGLRRKNP